MTSRAVTQEAIEDALVERFSGIIVDVKGIPTEVRVFLEDPDVEVYPERTFPSISIAFIGDSPNYERGMRESTTEEEEVFYDDSVDPPVRKMRIIPDPSVITFSIGTWNKDRAQTSRTLMFEVFRKRIKREGYLTVTNIDGDPIELWMSWSSDILPSNEVHPDMIVYHYNLDISIIANMAVVESIETIDKKVAKRLLWDVFSKEVNEDTGNVLDVRIEITENSVKPIN